MKIGFTGTQKGMTDKQKDTLRNILINSNPKPSEVHHGDCVGADEDFHYIVKGFSAVINKLIEIHIHPPSRRDKRAFCGLDDTVFIYERKDYLERNHDIVDACDVLVACPNSKEILRSGTWATIRYARKSDKTIHIIMPDGTVVVENKKEENKDGLLCQPDTNE